MTKYNVQYSATQRAVTILDEPLATQPPHPTVSWRQCILLKRINSLMGGPHFLAGGSAYISECLWLTHPLLLGQSTNTALLLCLPGKCPFFFEQYDFFNDHFPWTQHFLSYKKWLVSNLDLEFYKGGILGKAWLIAINSKRNIWKGIQKRVVGKWAFRAFRNKTVIHCMP